MNDKTTTWIGDDRRRETNLDLMFVSEEIVEGAKYYSQEKDSWGSDHVPVIVKIRHEGKVYAKKNSRLSNGKTERHRKGMRSRQEEIIRNKDCDVMERYNRLCTIMKEEVYKATGKDYKKDKEKEGKDVRKENGKGKKKGLEEKKKK